LRTSRSIPYAILILAVILTIALAPAHAVKYQTGVNNGDSSYYNLGGSYAAGTNVTRAVVVGVVGSNITESFTYYYAGGAKYSRFFWIDVFSGSSWNFTSNLFFVIATGLRSGDPIFSNWTNMTVMGPQSSPCGGTARQVDSMGYIRNHEIVQARWDTLTGILCDYQVNDPFRGTLLTMQMTNTTLWTASSGSDVFTTAVEVSSFLGVPLLVLIVFVYVRRRRRRRYQKPSK
jgi:hypothetical protein